MSDFNKATFELLDDMRVNLGLPSSVFNVDQPHQSSDPRYLLIGQRRPVDWAALEDLITKREGE